MTISMVYCRKIFDLNKNRTLNGTTQKCPPIVAQESDLSSERIIGRIGGQECNVSIITCV